MSRYSVGEGVKLKAGEGPVMTVTRASKKRVRVAYYDHHEKRFMREEFPPAALERSKASPAKAPKDEQPLARA